MRRRDLLTLLGGAAMAAWPFAALSQQAGRTYRVGLLSPALRIPTTDERRIALIRGLAERGYVEGRNLAFDERSADSHFERLPALAAELNAAKVDVLVNFGYPAAFAAKQAASNVPIVMIGAGDPVATGLVEGLARSGGNITGLTELSTELSAKRLELLRDAVPRLGLVAMLWNAADVGMSMRYQAAEGAAGRLGIEVQTLGYASRTTSTPPSPP